MSTPEWIKGIGKVYLARGSSVFVEVPLKELVKTLERLRSRGVRAINAISGHDNGREIEVLYHFIHKGTVLTIKTRVGKRTSSLPSIAGIFPSAALFEQENHEMLGLVFGSSKAKPLLLGKHSPATPLRKKEEET